MKMPAPPPDTDQLMAELLAGDRLATVWSRIGVQGLGDGYLAWDKLRFKTPPDGLTLPEWWLVLKGAALLKVGDFGLWFGGSGAWVPDGPGG
jgi:hypothetical protein